MKHLSTLTLLPIAAILHLSQAQHNNESIPQNMSSCANGELELGISIYTPPSDESCGEISWSIHSTSGEIVRSGPFSSSHAMKYEHHLCFDETKCHTFIINDTYGGRIRNLHQSNTSSLRVSINDFIVFENPWHSFPSFHFNFGRCETKMTDSTESSNSDEIHSISRAAKQPQRTTEHHETEAQRPSSPAPSINPTTSASQDVGEDSIMKRCETEVMLVIALLLFILVPRLLPLLCCLKSIWCIKTFMASSEKKDESEDSTMYSQCNDARGASCVAEDFGDEENQRPKGNNDDEEGENSGGRFQSLMKNVSSGISLIREIKS